MIRNFLTSFQLFSSAEINELVKMMKPKKLQKGDFFIQEGKTCKEVAFINTGILRTFFRAETGVETTYCITFPGALMTAYASFITGKPTIENIQALAPTDLLLIQKRDLDYLSATNPNWSQFLRIIAEQQYLELEKRVFQFQQEKAKKRYLDLLENQSTYVQQIPLQYLASYLGITPRHLSRLRNEISL
ncbi:Crp/Fnr family transcriptional regulator [Pedobacter gandavensis]|uniref:Cyclic nucleotide-binding domain-containing protein n=1 Tax=Pedobacter gandavensis TaxID=2679963 RepID=A0ABR6ETL7_9SPHI|nr:Crp/Fnr family transcriptional regulator [Pedobacter gandavensis]MBB2147763.1 cyclic nucleotide-binding domain-containing protein [Pedobacter gandavensis]